MTEPLGDAGVSREGAALVTALRVVRERWPIIVAAVVIALALTLGFSLSATKQYESSARLLFRASDLATLIDPSAANNRDPQRDQGTNVLLVGSSTVADRVRKALRLPDSADALLSQVVVTAEPDTDIVDITATDPDPQRAARIAEAFATQFVSYRRDIDLARLNEGAADLQKQIDALPPGESSKRTTLQAALNSITGLRAVNTGDVEIVDHAGVPGTPSSPNPKRDAALGLVLGAIAGLAIAFLVDLFDRRIKAVEDFEAALGLRALAALPHRTRDPTTQRERQAALEPFRILRSGLGFLALTRDVRVVMVTSSMPGEGKSTVAAGLARAAALAGQNVVLVEADLRRPTFHEQFDLGEDGRGLTTALLGMARPLDLLREALPGLSTLSVLPSGPLPPNSAELLRSVEMSEVLRELADEMDLVILDAPPLLPVADAQVLLDHPQVDAGLIVVRAFQTTRDDVRRTRAVLERHRLRNLGLVVNGLQERGSGYDYYGEAAPVPDPRATNSALPASTEPESMEDPLGR